MSITTNVRLRITLKIFFFSIVRYDLSWFVALYLATLAELAALFCINIDTGDSICLSFLAYFCICCATDGDKVSLCIAGRNLSFQCWPCSSFFLFCSGYRPGSSNNPRGFIVYKQEKTSAQWLLAIHSLPRGIPE